jgi:hypothetical protein
MKTNNMVGDGENIKNLLLLLLLKYIYSRVERDVDHFYPVNDPFYSLFLARDTK